MVRTVLRGEKALSAQRFVTGVGWELLGVQVHVVENPLRRVLGVRAPLPVRPRDHTYFADAVVDGGTEL